MWALLQRIFASLFGRSAAQPSQSPQSGQANKIKFPSSIPPAKPAARSKTGKRSLAAIVGIGAAGILSTFVPKFEGMILRGYKDPVGIVTACAGHTKTAVLGRAYTRQECDQLLDQDLASHAAGVMACIKVPTSVGERAAYASFGYNVGVGAFCKSTMARKLNAQDYRGACDELLKWTKAGGRELKGLVRRRAAERELCLQDGSRS